MPSGRDFLLPGGRSGKARLPHRKISSCPKVRDFKLKKIKKKWEILKLGLDTEFIMKLKKIASLALAGIMAVSMLAGCKDGGNGNNGSSSSENTNTTSNVTESVLAKSSKAVNNVLTVNADDTLDEAVAFAAENAGNAGDYRVLTNLPSTHAYAVNALKIADEWYYTANSVEQYKFTSNDNHDDETYWSLYIVTAPKTNDWILGEVADKLDEMVKSTTMDGQNCEYSVRVATAEINAASSGSTDGYLVGIAITVDDTSNNH